jgi:uncharacterized protein YdeI (YjbR/CyaY-like superfamily)
LNKIFSFIYAKSAAAMVKDETDSFYPTSRKQWRKWLEKNHDKKDAVWLICYKKEAKKATVAWSDIVDESLCFGWIDSIRKSIDNERYKQRLTKRKAKSTWSKINKNKAERLIKEGLMTEAGLKAIDVAKKNGYWSILDEVEELIIPSDLESAFKKKAGSKAHFQSLSRSARRMLLLGLVMTKQKETRIRRIKEL